MIGLSVRSEQDLQKDNIKDHVPGVSVVTCLSHLVAILTEVEKTHSIFTFLYVPEFGFRESGCEKTSTFRSHYALWSVLAIVERSPTLT